MINSKTNGHPEPWLTCRGLTKQYGGVLALDGADFDVRAGEVHGIVGPNGAGKSTLAKILGAAIKMDAGSLRIDGETIALRDPADGQRHRLVLMPQEIAVVPAADLVDNITLGAEPGKLGFRSSGECRHRAAAAMAAVGLEIEPTTLAGALTGAHQRMLMMARAVNREARLLILDEPTAGLPPHEAKLVGQAIRKLLDYELTVLYVSHHLAEVAELCDRVTFVHGGRIAGTIAGDEVTKEALVSNLLAGAGQPEASTGSGTPPRGRGASISRPRPHAGGPARAAGLELVDVSGERIFDVSVTASVGEVTGITGLLGSGVTELASIVVGAAKPRSGAMRIDGVEVRFSSPAAALGSGVGYLAGDRTRSAFTSLAIRENVSLAALGEWFGRLGIVRRGREKSLVGKTLAQLSVAGDPERPLGALSGGNQQRALVARLVAANLQILVLDEPTVGVDIKAREELWSVVRNLARDRTVIVISSEPEELVALCDRVFCIRRGQIGAVLHSGAITEHAIVQAIS